MVGGFGLILGHMTKCTYMQGICTIVHCLHMYCVCMMDLVIMPKTLIFIATYTCGEGEWVVGL